MTELPSDLAMGRRISRRQVLRVVGLGAATGVLHVVAPTPVAGQSARRTLERFPLLLSWKINAQRAPYILAQDRGYFAEQGLDFVMVEGSGSANTAKTVGAGTSPMGEVDGGYLILAVSNGIPIKAVAGVLQQGANTVIVPRASGITTPKGLEGKRLAGTAGSSGENLLPFWLKRNGADPDKVQLVPLAAAARNTALLRGQVDGSIGYTTDDFVTFRAQGLDVVAIRYADFGFSIPSLSLVANTDFLRSKPDMIRRFLRAALRGWADARQDPAAAAAAFMKREQAQGWKVEVVRESVKESVRLLSTKRTQGKPVGWMAAEDWQEALDILAESGSLPTKPRVDDVMTNEFVPVS